MEVVFINMILKILIAVICTEALTELAVKSELFQPVRAWLYKNKYSLLRFIHRILDCGYCFSVWAAILAVIFVFYLDTFRVHFLVLVLVVHRLSNLFHFFIDAMRDVFRK